MGAKISYLCKKKYWIFTDRNQLFGPKIVSSMSQKTEKSVKHYWKIIFLLCHTNNKSKIVQIKLKQFGSIKKALSDRYPIPISMYTHWSRAAETETVSCFVKKANVLCHTFAQRQIFRIICIDVFYLQSCVRPSENLTKIRTASSAVRTWASAWGLWDTCQQRWNLSNSASKSVSPEHRQIIL